MKTAKEVLHHLSANQRRTASISDSVSKGQDGRRTNTYEITWCKIQNSKYEYQQMYVFVFCLFVLALLGTKCARRLSSSVRPSSSINFPLNDISSQFDETSHECSLGEPFQSCSNGSFPLHIGATKGQRGKILEQTFKSFLVRNH